MNHLKVENKLLQFSPYFQIVIFRLLTSLKGINKTVSCFFSDIFLDLKKYMSKIDATKDKIITHFSEGSYHFQDNLQ